MSTSQSRAQRIRERVLESGGSRAQAEAAAQSIAGYRTTSEAADESGDNSGGGSDEQTSGGEGGGGSGGSSEEVATDTSGANTGQQTETVDSTDPQESVTNTIGQDVDPVPDRYESDQNTSRGSDSPPSSAPSGGGGGGDNGGGGGGATDTAQQPQPETGDTGGTQSGQTAADLVDGGGAADAATGVETPASRTGTGDGGTTEPTQPQPDSGTASGTDSTGGTTDGTGGSQSPTDLLDGATGGAAEAAAGTDPGPAAGDAGGATPDSTTETDAEPTGSAPRSGSEDDQTAPTDRPDQSGTVVTENATFSSNPNVAGPAQELQERATEQLGFESTAAVEVQLVREDGQRRLEAVVTEYGRRQQRERVAENIETQLETTRAERTAQRARAAGASEAQAEAIRENIQYATGTESTLETSLDEDDVTREQRITDPADALRSAVKDGTSDLRLPGDGDSDGTELVYTLSDEGRETVQEAQREKAARLIDDQLPTDVDEEDVTRTEQGGYTLSQQGRRELERFQERRRAGIRAGQERALDSALRARRAARQRTGAASPTETEQTGDEVSRQLPGDDQPNLPEPKPDQIDPVSDSRVEQLRDQQGFAGRETAPQNLRRPGTGETVARSGGPTPEATPQGDVSEFARNLAAAGLDFAFAEPRLTTGPFDLTQEEIKRRTGGIGTPGPNINFKAVGQSIERGIDIATFQENVQTVEGPILEAGESDAPNPAIVDSLTQGKGLFASGTRRIDRPDQLLNRPDIGDPSQLSADEIEQRYAEATPGIETEDINVTRTERGVRAEADLDTQDVRERVAATNEGVSSEDVIVTTDREDNLQFETSTGGGQGFFSETERSLQETVRGRQEGFDLSDDVPDAVPSGPVGSALRGVASVPGQVAAAPPALLLASDKVVEGTANLPRTAGEFGPGRTAGAIGIVGGQLLEQTSKQAAENPARFTGQVAGEAALGFAASRAVRGAPGRVADIRTRVRGKPIVDLDDRITSERVASGEADIPEFETGTRARVSQAVEEIRARAADQPIELQNLDRFGVAEATAFRAGRFTRRVGSRVGGRVREATPDVSTPSVPDRPSISRSRTPERSAAEKAGRATGQVTGRVPDTPVDRPTVGRPTTPEPEFPEAERRARDAGERVRDVRERVTERVRERRQQATSRVEGGQGAVAERLPDRGPVTAQRLDIPVDDGTDQVVSAVRLQNPVARSRESGITLGGFRGARPFAGSPVVDLGNIDYDQFGRATDPSGTFAPATGIETDIVRKSLSGAEARRSFETARGVASIAGRGRPADRDLSARRAIERVDEIPDEATDDVLRVLQETDATIKGSASAVEQVGSFRAPGDLDLIVDDPNLAETRLRSALEGTDAEVDEAFDLVTEDFTTAERGLITLGQRQRSTLTTEEGIPITPVEEELVRKVQGGAANIRAPDFADEAGARGRVDVGAKPSSEAPTRLKDVPDIQVLAREVVTQRSRQTNPLNIVGQARRGQERRILRRFEDASSTELDVAPTDVDVPEFPKGPVRRGAESVRATRQAAVSAVADTRVATAAQQVRDGAQTARDVVERPLEAGERAGYAAGQRVNAFIDAAEERRPGDGGLPDSLLLRSESDPLPSDLEAQRGQYELPGLFASPDLSLLRLSREDVTSRIPNIRLGIPFARNADDQVTVFPGDEIEGMPPRAAGSGRIFPDDGDPFPDPDTAGARYLEGEAEEGVAYVRAAGDRTTELEVVFPPGSLFREIEQFRLRVEGRPNVTGRAFERVDPSDVEGLGDDATEATGSSDGLTPLAERDPTETQTGELDTGRTTVSDDETSPLDVFDDTDGQRDTGDADLDGNTDGGLDADLDGDDGGRVADTDGDATVPGDVDRQTRRSDGATERDEPISQDEVVTAGELPETRVSRRGPDADAEPVSPAPAPSADTGQTPTATEVDTAAAAGQRGAEPVVDAAETMADLFRSAQSRQTPQATGARERVSPVESPGVTSAGATERVSELSGPSRVSTPSEPSDRSPSEPSVSTPTYDYGGSEPGRTPTQPDYSVPSQSVPTRTPNTSIPATATTTIPNTPVRQTPRPDEDEAPRDVVVNLRGEVAKRFGGEVATARSVRDETFETFGEVRFTKGFERAVDTDDTPDVVEVLGDPTEQEVQQISNLLDEDLS